MYRSKLCKHIWMDIIQSCGPGMGFKTCPLFTHHGTIFDEPRIIELCGCENCPIDGRHGLYCKNTTRMVTDIKCGIKFGRDVHSWTPGVEMLCAVM
jgi:hypothetical protein